MGVDSGSKPGVRAARLAELGQIEGEDLQIGGVSAESLAERHGTPLYVYDAAVMRGRLAAVRDTLGDRVKVFYAIKANPSIGVIQVFQKAGAGAEVASCGEIEAAVRAGFSGNEIQFAGPGKSRSEVELAVTRGISRLNVESEAEYELVADVCRERDARQRVAVRVNPSESVTGARMRMGGGSQKFGVDVDQLEPLLRRIVDEDVVDLCGLHVYGGTQAFDAHGWVQNAEALMDLANRMESQLGIRLRELNFGGGFGIGYFEGDPTFDLELAGAELGALIAKDDRADREYHVELGRYLTATSGVYLTRVIRTKISAGRPIAIVDGGMHHHAAAAGVGSVLRRSFPIIACNAVDDSSTSYGVGGPLCTPADEFSSEVALPELERGDLLAILGSGAYGMSFSNVMFLSHPTPAEVLLEDGHAYEIRARGTPEDWLRGQRLPERKGPA